MTLAEAAIAKLAALPTNRTILITIKMILPELANLVIQRMRNTRNAVIFNISDRQQLEKDKQTIVKVCNMGHCPGRCVRLRKDPTNIPFAPNAIPGQMFRP